MITPTGANEYKVGYLSLKAAEAGAVVANFEPNQPQDPAFMPDKIRFVGSDGQTVASTYGHSTLPKVRLT